MERTFVGRFFVLHLKRTIQILLGDNTLTVHVRYKVGCFANLIVKCFNLLLLLTRSYNLKYRRNFLVMLLRSLTCEFAQPFIINRWFIFWELCEELNLDIVVYSCIFLLVFDWLGLKRCNLLSQISLSGLFDTPFHYICNYFYFYLNLI